jgi:hypothetical protein
MQALSGPRAPTSIEGPQVPPRTRIDGPVSGAHRTRPARRDPPRVQSNTENPKGSLPDPIVRSSPGQQPARPLPSFFLGLPHVPHRFLLLWAQPPKHASFCCCPPYLRPGATRLLPISPYLRRILRPQSLKSCLLSHCPSPRFAWDALGFALSPPLLTDHSSSSEVQPGFESVCPCAPAPSICSATLTHQRSHGVFRRASRPHPGPRHH